MIATHITNRADLIKRDGYIKPKVELQDSRGFGAMLRPADVDEKFTFFGLTKSYYRSNFHVFKFDVDVLFNEYNAGIRFESPTKMAKINESLGTNYNNDKVSGKRGLELLNTIKEKYPNFMNHVEVIVRGAVPITAAFGEAVMTPDVNRQMDRLSQYQLNQYDKVKIQYEEPKPIKIKVETAPKAKKTYGVALKVEHFSDNKTVVLATTTVEAVSVQRARKHAIKAAQAHEEMGQKMAKASGNWDVYGGVSTRYYYRWESNYKDSSLYKIEVYDDPAAMPVMAPEAKSEKKTYEVELQVTDYNTDEVYSLTRTTVEAVSLRRARKNAIKVAMKHEEMGPKMGKAAGHWAVYGSESIRTYYYKNGGENRKYEIVVME